MDRYKKIAMLMCSVGLILILTGVTYSFFNYTRTGALNNLGTGRIYFNSEQNGSLNMTNIFPMTGTQAGEANLDTVTVGIVGDTTYANGEEFEIKLVDVTNTINGKKIPIKYIATYEATTGNSIGTSSNDYWNARESKNADIYLLNATGGVEEGKQVLVGYIKNSATGINGTLTIKAYIDADRIAISDTYNPNAVEPIPNGNGQGGAASASTSNDKGKVKFLAGESNPTTDEYGTTTNWVNGRTVFTTNEWNSFQSSGSPIRFKIRAESNEGIWVEEPAQGTIESCPGCKFMYLPNTPMYTTWNTNSQTPTQITTGLYDNYQELMTATGRSYFLGVKLNNNNEVTNAYVCGVKDNVPFCIEGTSDGSKYTANQTLLQGANLWNNTCNVGPLQTGPDTYDDTQSQTVCGDITSSSLSAGAISYGNVNVGVDSDDNCDVNNNGNFGCRQSDPK